MAVVLNCGSRSSGAAQQRAHIGELLQNAGIAADLLCSERGADLGELLQSTLRKPYRMIVAAGGDGTVSAVAGAVAGTDKALGVLPLGTVNHFAKRLGVPVGLEAAVAALADAVPARIDVGEVNGRVFVNNSTIGIYPRIIRFREHLRKERGLHKWVAFAWAALRMLRRTRHLDVQVIAAGQERRAATPFVFIGTGDFKLGDVDLGAGSKPDQGELGVCIARPRGRLHLLKLAAVAAAGGENRGEDLEIIRAGDVLVQTTQPRRLHVTVDGETVVLRTPLRYRARPGALLVMAPRATSERGTSEHAMSPRDEALPGPAEPPGRQATVERG